MLVDDLDNLELMLRTDGAHGEEDHLGQTDRSQPVGEVLRSGELLRTVQGLPSMISEYLVVSVVRSLKGIRLV